MKTPNILKSMKSMKQRNRGAVIGFILGTLLWLLSVDLAIGISMIPVVVILGMVALNYVVVWLVISTTTSVVGYAFGLLMEKMGQKQGVFTGAVTVVAIAVLFLTLWKPVLPANTPAPQAAAIQASYAMKPFETLASVAKMGYEPGNIFISYAHNPTYQPNSCPAECRYGCLDSGICKPVPNFP